MNEASVWQALETVMDPEIPVVSLVEMGIIRDVVVDGHAVHVTMTPTFSGCPALVVMETAVTNTLHALGAVSVTIVQSLSPPWTSDWITDAGRQKLKAFGLQPPRKHGGNLVATFFDIVPCPRCNSTNTSIKNSFGSTLCRAIWYCNDCQEPFEQFKPL